MQLLTQAETAKLVDVSLAKFRTLVSCGIIKPTVIAGQRQFWKPDDIEEIKITLDLYKQDRRQKTVEKNMPRALRYKEMYKTMTLAEIGAVEGITRERVRQILVTVGVTANDGGAHQRCISNTARREQAGIEAREERCQRQYGCSFDVFRELTGCARLGRNSKLIKLYLHHKYTATRAGLIWGITLPEYAEFITPHIHKIGLKRSSLVLGRKDKSKDFTPDNVHLVSLEENSRQTNGFACARLFQAKKTKQHVTTIKNMREQGYSINEITSNLGLSRARVMQLISICEHTPTTN